MCLERGKMKTETRGTPTFQEVGGGRRVREGVARDRREEKKHSRIPCRKVFRRGGIEGKMGGPKGAEEGKLQQQGLRLDKKLPRRFQ